MLAPSRYIHPSPSLHGLSRAAGIAIDEKKDAVRAECAGKSGTVLEVDQGDNTAKVKVLTEPGKAATLWFAIAACEPM